jgi:hypothetical protein
MKEDTANPLFLLLDSRLRIEDRLYFYYIPDGTESRDFSSTLFGSPDGDTMKFHSNGKMTFPSPEEESDFDILIRRYENDAYVYTSLHSYKRDATQSLITESIFSGAVGMIGIALLTSESTKTQNAGGVVCGLSILGLIESLGRYIKRRPKWEGLDEAAEKLENWDEAVNRNILEEELDN